LRPRPNLGATSKSTEPELTYEFIETLANDKLLPDAAHDHALKGRWAGYRECHIRPDLLLIYKKPTKGH